MCHPYELSLMTIWKERWFWTYLFDLHRLDPCYYKSSNAAWSLLLQIFQCKKVFNMNQQYSFVMKGRLIWLLLKFRRACVNCVFSNYKKNNLGVGHGHTITCFSFGVQLDEKIANLRMAPIHLEQGELYHDLPNTC